MTADIEEFALEASRSPPSLHFLLSWADESVQQSLMTRMRANQRQTMNLRLSAMARLLHLQRQEDRATVGWAGVDVGNLRYPELFSLFLMPGYRACSLGLLLELVRYEYLRRRGIQTAYLRIEAATSATRLRYRLSRTLFREMDPAALDPAYVQRCEKCELYQTLCTQQAFFQVDVDEFVQYGERCLGPVDVESLPREFSMVEDHRPNRAQPGLKEVVFRPVWR